MTPLDGDIAEPHRDLSLRPREEGDQPPQFDQELTRMVGRSKKLAI